MVFYDIISDKLGPITGADNVVVVANKSFVTTFPVLYDALYVVGGTAQDQSMFDLEVQNYVNMAYKHYKPIGIATTGDKYMKKTGNRAGVVFAKDSSFEEDFVAAISKQRFWDRT